MGGVNLFFDFDKPEKVREREIWAIGGGKGGTGKSFISSSIGTYLASKGKRVILIDADFGGANLHSFLGIKKPRLSLADFLEKKAPLDSLVIDTGINGLGLIAGTLYSLDFDSIKYFQKLKFLRQIKALEADFIIIDLGAGAHFTTIDTALVADKMIVAIVPEITSIDNMNHFIKNVLYRRLQKTFAAHGLKDVIQDAWKNRWEYGINNLRDLINHLKGASTYIRDLLEKEISEFRIYVVLNQVRSILDVSTGASVRSLCRKCYGFRASYVGYIEHDETVCNYVNRAEPFMLTYPTARSAREIIKVTENLLKEQQVKIMRG
jgi:flagellar biosynthesis protein FlhG